MIKFLLTLLFVLFSFAAQAQIGKIVIIEGAVTIERNNQIITPQINDLVYEQDRVKTQQGKIAIRFVDNTAFQISENAEIFLDKYIFNPTGTNNQTLFSLIKGTFVFVAGKIAKTGDMKINTPVATMGIRGTTPMVVINEDGSVYFRTLLEERKR